MLPLLLLAAAPPNVLVVIADDWGRHAGAYGTRWVRTPAFDQLARDGLLFQQAYTPLAKCAPSRAVLLTGRYPWQLEAACNHQCHFPPKFRTYPEALAAAGWAVGCTGKGWGPGVAVDAAGKPRQLAGKPVNAHKLTPPAKEIGATDYARNFAAFLDAAPAGKPWSFWCGITEPHRGYEAGVGARLGGKSPADIDRVPGYWPDTPEVRADMLDYAYEVEYADRQLAAVLAELDRRKLAANTLVVVTSDHGMPFPRVKGYAYPDGNRVPLAVRWPGGVTNPGRAVAGFVDFADLAATVYDVAGLANPTSGASWRPIFAGTGGGRDFALVGKERTDVGRPGDVGYPIRGVVRDGFLLLKNFEPERWPAGNPETGYLDTDGGPTKSLILERGRPNRADRHWQLCFGKRPADELYDLTADTDCVVNLAGRPEVARRQGELLAFLTAKLTAHGDPRMTGDGAVFDRYPPTSGRGFYEAWMRGEKPAAGWVRPTDFEPRPLK